MKSFAAIAACGAFFLLWLMRVTALRRDAKAFDELCAFCRSVKNGLRFHLSRYDEIALICEREGYQYIKNGDSGLCADSRVSEALRSAFSGFVSKLGTTDCDGQLDICDEFLERLEDLRPDFKDENAKKLKVCTVFNLTLALCCVLLAF